MMLPARNITDLMLEVSDLVWEAEQMFSPLDRWDGSYPPPPGRHTALSFYIRDSLHPEIGIDEPVVPKPRKAEDGGLWQD
jgi:hypothetical protein